MNDFRQPSLKSVLNASNSSLKKRRPPGRSSTTDSWDTKDRNDTLARRLEALLVLELKKDGTKNYLHLSTRALYEHVITAITSRSMAERLEIGNTPKARKMRRASVNTTVSGKSGTLGESLPAAPLENGESGGNSTRKTPAAINLNQMNVTNPTANKSRPRRNFADNNGGGFGNVPGKHYRNASANLPEEYLNDSTQPETRKTILPAEYLNDGIQPQTRRTPLPPDYINEGIHPETRKTTSATSASDQQSLNDSSYSDKHYKNVVNSLSPEDREKEIAASVVRFVNESFEDNTEFTMEYDHAVPDSRRGSMESMSMSTESLGLPVESHPEGRQGSSTSSSMGYGPQPSPRHQTIPGNITSSRTQHKQAANVQRSRRASLGLIPESHANASQNHTAHPAHAANQSQTTSHSQRDLENVTYRERLGGYLHPRDMRRLVTPFSATNEPELIVRRHVMLLNFDPLRAIITRDRLLVLVPDGADALLGTLEQRVRGGTKEIENSIFGAPGVSKEIVASESAGTGMLINIADGALGAVKLTTGAVKATTMGTVKGTKFLFSEIINKGSLIVQKITSNGSQCDDDEDIPSDSSDEEDDDESTTYDDAYDEESEWDEIEGREWIDLPFELQCVDAVMYVVGSILSEDTADLQKAALNYIQGFLTQNGSLNDDPLTIIRAIKDSTREMTSRVKGFVQSMNRILDEDKSMALMNLSRLLTHPERFIQPVSAEVLAEEADEPELILEANLQIGLTLLNSLDLIQGKIDTASQMVDQKLDAMRNRILFANMLISVVSLCVASGSFVGSIFGMNLTNHFEDDPNAFMIITFATLAGAVGMAIFFFAILLYSGTIPRTTVASGVEL